jgi:uncharacterized protein YutE (UPF0331/DUF86 family)
MTPDKIRKRIILDRLDYIDAMLADINALPLGGFDYFSEDRKNIHAAESCLRRALEALLDVGRHILAKSFSKGMSEYKAIAIELGANGVLQPEETKLLVKMAGYRNRMVHFYHEITPGELYQICSNELRDILLIEKAYLTWIKENPDRIDEEL